MQAYCMKCRAKREMKNARSVTMKNGRLATEGVCLRCGTNVFRTAPELRKLAMGSLNVPPFYVL